MKETQNYSILIQNVYILPIQVIKIPIRKASDYMTWMWQISIDFMVIPAVKSFI